MRTPLLAIVGLLLPLVVGAEDFPRQAEPETHTEAWLRVQASNSQASSIKQLQTDKERDQAMQRWLNTYKYEIPDFFRWTRVRESNN